MPKTFTREQRMRVLNTLLVSCGTESLKTVNPADPTDITTRKAKVFLTYGFSNDNGVESPREDAMPCPPDCELVDLTVIEDMSTIVTVTCSLGKYRLCWQPTYSGYAGQSPIKGHVVSVASESFTEGSPFKKREAEVFAILNKLILEGDWRGKNAPDYLDMMHDSDTPSGDYLDDTISSEIETKRRLTLPESFEFRGKKYTYESETIDTDYGPELNVVIYGPNGEWVNSSRESMSAKQQIQQWKDQIEESLDKMADDGPYGRIS